MMITPKRAAEIVREKYPKGELYNAFEYREQFYVFRLQEGTKVSLDSPFFAVNKKTGQLTSITPMIDLTGFFRDLREHPIDVEGVKKSGIQQMANAPK